MQLLAMGVPKCVNVCLSYMLSWGFTSSMIYDGNSHTTKKDNNVTNHIGHTQTDNMTNLGSGLHPYLGGLTPLYHDEGVLEP